MTAVRIIYLWKTFKRQTAPKLRVPSWFILWRTMLNSCSFRQISLRMGRVRSGISKNSFHFITDTFLPFVEYGGKKFFPFTLQRTFLHLNAGIETKDSQKICAPAFAKAGARCIRGYEIWESSKHIRCPYTPKKWAVQLCSRYAHFDFWGSPTPLSCLNWKYFLNFSGSHCFYSLWRL